MLEGQQPPDKGLQVELAMALLPQVAVILEVEVGLASLGKTPQVLKLAMGEMV
jgi:hypothetical protein